MEPNYLYHLLLIYYIRKLQLDKTGAGEESRTLDLNLGKVALYQLSYSRVCKTKIITEKMFFFKDNLNNILSLGAGEESRTLDLNLGKVALYQLSYSRFVATGRHYI
ncbi:MAG: hypothetical protein JWP59_4270 [Massilia sp.]|nr:hypothetical protein [Massilia sp.]